MKIIVAGASGLIGGALVPALRADGHDVVRLVRRDSGASDEILWNPGAGEIDVSRIEGCDAIVNLCGENLAGGRWTERRREQIWQSRTDATRTLVVALGQLAHKPAVFVNASATGIYGDRGDEELTEASAIGHGFLPELCFAWETHAEGAAKRGVRTVVLRFGVVLTRKGGALAKMLPVFRLGLGGRLGDGKQWMSWVSLADAVGAIQHAVNDARCTGPMNVVASEPATNADFAATLARALGRPAAFSVPAWVLRLVFGEMANATLLASTRAAPERLRATGFAFRHETLEAALQAELR